MKFTTIPIVIIMFGLIACNSGNEKQSNHSELSLTKKNIALYEAWVSEVLNQGNPDAADKFLATEFVDHSLPPDMPGTIEGFKEWFSMFNSAFPDAKWNMEYIAGIDDMVFHHKTMAGTHTGEYMGIPGSGEKITTQETGIMRFKDGKIVEFWGTFDEFSITNQLGLIKRPN